MGVTQILILHPPLQTQSTSFCFLLVCSLFPCFRNSLMCQARSKPPSLPSLDQIHFSVLDSSSGVRHCPSGFSMLAAVSCAVLTWAELSSIYCTRRWGRVWIQKDWEGEGSLRGENLANKVGSSSFKPAASFLCAQPSPRKGAWGSTGCREKMSLVGFLQLPSCPVTERGKATEGDKQGNTKILLQRARFKAIPIRRGGGEE